MFLCSHVLAGDLNAPVEREYVDNAFKRSTKVKKNIEPDTEYILYIWARTNAGMGTQDFIEDKTLAIGREYLSLRCSPDQKQPKEKARLAQTTFHKTQTKLRIFSLVGPDSFFGTCIIHIEHKLQQFLENFVALRSLPLKSEMH